MKKKSIICAVLVLVMVFAGTGYAYWTDSLSVNTTLTTGDMELTFVDLGLYAQYGADELVEGRAGWTIIDGIGQDGYVEDNAFRRDTSNYNIIAAPGTIQAYYDRAAGYNSVEFDAELVDAQPIVNMTTVPYNGGNANGSDTIAISVENMYPGYAQAFRSDLLNVGSVAAKLSKLVFDVETDNEVATDMLGVAILMEKEMHGGYANIQPVFKLAEAVGVSPADIFTMGGVQFVRLSALADLEIADVTNNDLLADPNGNAMDLFLAVAMDPDAEGVYTTGSSAVMADNNDAASQNTGASFSIQLIWDQFNVGVGNDAPANILQKQNG